MQIIDFYNNPNVGLFFYTTNKITIVPKITSDAIVEIIENELKTKIIKLDIMKSSVNNIFLVGDEKYLFVAKGVSDETLKELEKTKLKVIIIDSKLNALGNNMVLYKKKIVLNPNFEDSVVEQLQDLGFDVFKTKIATVETVGANLVMFDKKGLVNNSITDKEYERLTNFLDIELEKGTVNNKSPIVKAGFVKNKNGIIVSNEMSGSEMMVLEELMD